MARDLENRTRDRGFHRILVWEDFEEGHDFLGIMLTTSDRWPNNIALPSEYINDGFDFVFNNTHFVNRIFIKLNEWNPFDKVGEIGSDGLTYIEENLINDDPITFAEYLHFT